jgi:hypothetical protein
MLTAASTGAACGASSHQQSNRGQIKAAIQSSPDSFFAYRDPRYWARPVHFAIRGIRFSDRDARFAAARVFALDAAGKRAVFPQQLLLEKKAAGWRVVQASASGSDSIACHAAPAGVVCELLGDCNSIATLDPVLSIEGPTDMRVPTPSERAQIIAATRAVHFKPGQDGCVRYLVHVSRVDGRFASVGYEFVKPYTGCLLGDGVTLMERATTGHWRVEGDASDPFGCHDAPPGVIRSLFGWCSVWRDDTLAVR